MGFREHVLEKLRKKEKVVEDQRDHRGVLERYLDDSFIQKMLKDAKEGLGIKELDMFIKDVKK